jgi:DNA-binding NtrC family response regulator
VVAADQPDRARAGDLRPGPRMVGRSESFRRLVVATRKLASLTPPVLVMGETGTGKELVARALHETGDREGRRFVAINCAAIPEQLAESQLFGHVRGAFTGADRAHTGAFVRAHGGTLFLDEVAELPLTSQAKLLRALETGCVTPVGSEHEIPVDVRVVSATHRPIAKMVEAGQLREDLFHRLSVFVLRVPPLRERPQDIPPLLDHFLAQAARELGREVALSREAVDAARRHAWPGNVRALRNAVLRAAALCDGPIGAEALVGPAPSGESAADDARSPGFVVGEAGSGAEVGAIYVPRGDYASMQHSMLRQVVAEAGSIRRAARVLGVPRSTLGAWLRRGS